MRRIPSLLVVALLLGARGAWGATFTVTTTADTADGTCDAHCSLREAVIAANATPESDTISLPEGVFTLTRAGADEDASLTGDLDVTGALHIIGMGKDRSVIRGIGTDRIIEVRSGALQLTDLGVSGGGGVSEGGGLVAYGGSVVHFAHVAFVGNRATVQGGAVKTNGSLLVADSFFAGNVGGSYCGALCPYGSTEIVRSTFVANHATYGGGAITTAGSTVLAVSDTLIAANTSGYGGGAHLDRSTDTFTNVTFSANAALEGGGGAVSSNRSTTAFHNCSFVSDTGDNDGSSIEIVGEEGQITLENTLLWPSGIPFPCHGGPPVSLGHNLGLCWLSGPGDLEWGRAGVGALRDNGGSTMTHELLAGSEAIDAGGGTFAATDQRGTPRPVGAAPDIGAYEADGDEPPIGTPLTVPVIAHLGGVGGTPWRSDVSLSNVLDVQLPLTLRYTPNEGSPVTATVTLDEFETVVLEDLVSATFALGDGRGALEIIPPAAGPVPAVLSRTYAVAGSERLGQGMPALRPLPVGTYYIPGLREDDLYRSNLGLTAGDEDLTVQVDLYRGTDGPVGSTFAQNLSAGTQVQWRFPVAFPGLAHTGVPMTARVRIFGEAAPYGSLVDQISTDAVTLMAQPASSVWTVPVIAHNPGGAGTFWRSDLFLHNPNPIPARIELEYLPENTDNSAGGQTAVVTVPAYGTVTVADAAGTLFGVSNGKGALVLVGSPRFVVSSRTYTTRAAAANGANVGTYGLGVPAVPPWQITAGQKTIPGVRVGNGYRTNLGFVGGHTYESIHLMLFDADGTQLAQTFFKMPPRSLMQASVQGLFDIDWGAFTSGSVRIIATRRPLLVYTSIVDGSSQDPIYEVASTLMP